MRNRVLKAAFRSTPLMALIAAGALALSCCGVPSSGTPQSISRSTVPFGLLDRPPASRPAGEKSSSSLAVPVTVYLVNSANGRLVPEPTSVPYPATLAALTKALLAGPTTAESAAGIQTAIPSQTTVSGVTTLDGIATVDLSAAFAESVGPELITAAAQVVYTVTSVTAVTGVSFEISGKPVSVPMANGTITVQPVTRSDFASVAPVP